MNEATRELRIGDLIGHSGPALVFIGDGPNPTVYVLGSDNVPSFDRPRDRVLCKALLELAELQLRVEEMDHDAV